MGWGLIIDLGHKSLDSYEFMNRFISVSIPFEEYIDDSNINQVIVYHDDKIIALRIYRILEDRIHLTYTAVDVPYRGNSINHMMLLRIEDIAKNLGIDTLTSNVRESNLASLRSLEKSGFSPIFGQNLTYSNGEKKIPHMKKLIYNL